jgi:hypothetical protein
VDVPARYVSFYTNVALGRTLGAVFNLWIQTCARIGADRRAMGGCLVELIKCAEDVVEDFNDGDGQGDMGLGEEARAHVRSMEICVWGLRGWVDLLGVEKEGQVR